jgi:hypothetical protein
MADATERADPDLEKRLAAIEFARGSIAHLAPDRNLADELIADRRAEQAASDASRRGGDDR